MAVDYFKPFIGKAFHDYPHICPHFGRKPVDKFLFCPQVVMTA